MQNKSLINVFFIINNKFFAKFENHFNENISKNIFVEIFDNDVVVIKFQIEIIDC